MMGQKYSIESPVRVLSSSGFAGDRLPEGALEVAPLAGAIAEAFSVAHVHGGVPAFEKTSSVGSALALSESTFRATGQQVADTLDDNATPILVMARCAPAMATIPEVLKRFPDAVVIWLDAHGDLNTPDASETGYLGGVCLSALLGEWQSGFGSGLSLEKLALVGVRDLDRFEEEFVKRTNIPLFPRLDAQAISEIAHLVSEHPVYIHLDTDCFDPNEVPAEFQIPDGLNVDSVRRLFTALRQQTEIVGIEISEFLPRSKRERELGTKNIVWCLAPLISNSILAQT